MEQLKFDDEFNIKTKTEIAIDRLHHFEPFEGYYLAFSGGKDSIVCYELLVMAGVKFDAHYNLTTVDPPELVNFIKSNYPQVEIHYPKESMWQLIEKKMLPPTRKVRYCCSDLKENGGEGRFVITGVRWAESNRRRSSRQEIEFNRYGSKSKSAMKDREIFLNSDNSTKRRMIETCITKGKHILNPIIDWEDDEIWYFIESKKLKYPSLYDQGFRRIGCIGCPLQTTEGMKRDFKKYPKYKANYERAFSRMLENRKAKGLKNDKWKTGEDVMNWWVGQ